MTTKAPEYMAGWLGLVAPAKEPAPPPLTKEQRKEKRAAYQREWQRAHYEAKTERKPKKPGIFITKTIGVDSRDPGYQKLYHLLYRKTQQYKDYQRAYNKLPHVVEKRRLAKLKKEQTHASSNAVLP